MQLVCLMDYTSLFSNTSPRDWLLRCGFLVRTSRCRRYWKTMCNLLNRRSFRFFCRHLLDLKFLRLIILCKIFLMIPEEAHKYRERIFFSYGLKLKRFSQVNRNSQNQRPYIYIYVLGSFLVSECLLVSKYSVLKINEKINLLLICLFGGLIYVLLLFIESIHLSIYI